jgi:hypothetical protein
MGTVVFNYDVSKKITETYKSKTFTKLDAAALSLQIDDKVMDALEKSKDRDLASIKMVEKGQKLCEATTAALVALLKKLDEEADKAAADNAKRDKLVKDHRADQQKQLDDLKKNLKVLPEQQWNKFLQKYGEAKKEYRSYKVNAAADVAIGTLGVVGSAAALAGTVHTGGASLVLGCIGMVRSVTKIAEVVYSIAVDVEKQGNALSADLNALIKDFEKSKGKAVGKDLAKTAVNTVFDAPWFTTVSTAGKKAETLGGKVAGTYVGGVKLSRKVTESLNEQKKIAQLLPKLPDSKHKKKLDDELKKLQDNFDKLFEKAADLNAKAQRVEEQLKQVKSALKILKDDTKSLAVFEKVVGLLASIGFAGAGAGLGIQAAAGDALELSKEGIKLGSEIIVAAKEVFPEK